LIYKPEIISTVWLGGRTTHPTARSHGRVRSKAALIGEADVTTASIQLIAIAIIVIVVVVVVVVVDFIAVVLLRVARPSSWVRLLGVRVVRIRLLGVIGRGGVSIAFFPGTLVEAFEPLPRSIAMILLLLLLLLMKMIPVIAMVIAMAMTVHVVSIMVSMVLSTTTTLISYGVHLVTSIFLLSGQTEVRHRTILCIIGEIGR